MSDTSVLLLSCFGCGYALLSGRGVRQRAIPELLEQPMDRAEFLTHDPADEIRERFRGREPSRCGLRNGLRHRGPAICTHAHPSSANVETWSRRRRSLVLQGTAAEAPEAPSHRAGRTQAAGRRRSGRISGFFIGRSHPVPTLGGEPEEAAVEHHKVGRTKFRPALLLVVAAALLGLTILRIVYGRSRGS